MNREIKFRARRIDNGEWVYGDLIINRPTNSFRIWKDFANVKHGDFTESGLHECSGSLFNVIPETVGQYTGLRDRNGKDIYEGDILEGHSDGLVRVEWANENGGWECIFKDEANIGIAEMCAWFGNKAIVIGNIFENPELNPQ